MTLQIKWSPRVKKSQLHRLYKSEAAGHLDEELLEEVGLTLLLRCQEILIVDQAVKGFVRCPQCRARGEASTIHRTSHDPRTVMVCPACSWQATWGEYRKTFQRRQLSLGGAGGAFAAFVESWPAAREPRKKMLLVDRLIHEFHYALTNRRGVHSSLKDRPDVPVRAASVNLIDGKLTDVVAFLDALSDGVADKDLTAVHLEWREKLKVSQNWYKAPGT